MTRSSICKICISLTILSLWASSTFGEEIFTRSAMFNPDYNVTWTVNTRDRSVIFDVSANTLGYVGLGLSDSGSMSGADIVIGGVYPNKTAYFADRYAAGHGVPPVDQSQDWHLMAAAETADGRTTLLFTRAFETGDSQTDFDITTRNTSFIWAMGSSDDLTQHAERGFYLVNLLQEPTKSQ